MKILVSWSSGKDSAWMLHMLRTANAPVGGLLTSVEDRLAGSGLEPMFPLWGRNTRDLSREMLQAGVDARITCVDQRLLAKEFAGRRYDAELCAELPPGTDPCGERGEFHTCVLDGPMFGSRIDAEPGEIVVRGDFVFADLKISGGRAG